MAEIFFKTKNGTKVVLIQGTDAIKEFTKRDLFINNMSQFDFQSRLQSIGDISIGEYIDFISKQILDWDPKSINVVLNTITYLNSREIVHCLEFPETIYIILTNGKDESDAAYCRNLNLIILPQDRITESTESIDKSVKSLTNGSNWNSTIVHELFHIWSRKNNIELRDKLYEIIGYYRTPQIINLPNDLTNLKK